MFSTRRIELIFTKFLAVGNDVKGLKVLRTVEETVFVWNRISSFIFKLECKKQIEFQRGYYW